jgi:polar amino acid transport system permease protein
VHSKKLRITWLDAIVVALLLAFGGFVSYRLGHELNYRWNWAIIPQYLVRYDPQLQGWRANLLLEGLLTTLRLSLWAMLMAIVLGALMGILRTTRRLFNRLIGGAYVALIRNVPPLVLVFIFYFFVSDQIMPALGVESFVRACSPRMQRLLAALFAPPELFTAFISGTVTVAFFQGAYITEIVRAGIQSVERGQWEAGYALGFTWLQQMRHVVLPIAVKRVLPPLANEFINTVKYSAIVSVISIQELTFQGMQIMAATQVTIEVWLTITAMYLVLCLLLSFGVQRIETRLARSGA